MNDVERYTWNCMRHLMTTLDPNREGWCIDAGVGHFDFYFEWMHQLGYPTLAIEPVWSDDASRIIHNAVDAIPALYAVEGALVGELYVDERQGAQRPIYEARERDLRSLERFWGGMEVGARVAVFTLPYLIEVYSIQRITALKLDIEGAEPDVIESLRVMPANLLPAIISFEWGGEHPAKTERGAWHPSQRQRVTDSFTLLGDLGYARGLLIGSGDSFILRPIDGDALPPYFEPDDNWGNAILTRADVPMETLIKYAQTDEGING